MSRIVMVLTSSSGGGALERLTGFWFEELAAPYWEFRDAGHEVHLASIKGGAPPIDPASLDAEAVTESVRRFRGDDKAVAALEQTTPVA